MSNGIWNYHESENDKEETILRQMDCIFCGAPLVRDEAEDEQLFQMEMSYGWSDNFTTSVHSYVGICPVCGWWKYAYSMWNPGNRHISRSLITDLKYGILKNLDLTDVNTPVEEIRSYLLAKFKERFKVNPKSFENVVASVFHNLGYSAIVTAYSGDGGIDVILEKNHETIGIQVKRYKNSISVEQIRAFTGALVQKGYTKGIYVTTSEFQSGAPESARLSGLRGFPIELIDAPKFYDILKIAQLNNSYKDLAVKPWLRR